LKKLNDVDVIGHDGDVIGDAYEFLISQFASEAGKKAGEFYTPSMVSDMMAQIVTIDQKDKKLFSVFDPTMGSGSLMLNVRKYLNYPENVKFHGQELNTTTFNLAKMNLILHGVDSEDMNLRNGDTLNKDWPTDEPYTFDSVVMNPPYSAKWSADASFLDDSRFNRYGKLAPKSKADFAFLLHGYYHLKETGTMAIVLPHGVLFRGAAEGTIRQKLLEDGSIYAVIGMPANLFFGTSIQTTVIILKKNRTTRDVLFIDASNDFIKGKNQNKLSKENIEKIVSAFVERKDIEKYAHLASFDEIKENDYNLNIPRYVDTFEDEEPIDMVSVGKEIKKIREEKQALEKSLFETISTLEASPENKEWLKGALEVFAHGK
jgi:type I restriction enzyme M protein